MGLHTIPDQRDGGGFSFVHWGWLAQHLPCSLTVLPLPPLPLPLLALPPLLLPSLALPALLLPPLPVRRLPLPPLPLPLPLRPQPLPAPRDEKKIGHLRQQQQEWYFISCKYTISEFAQKISGKWHRNIF